VFRETGSAGLCDGADAACAALVTWNEWAETSAEEIKRAQSERGVHCHTGETTKALGGDTGTAGRGQGVGTSATMLATRRRGPRRGSYRRMVSPIELRPEDLGPVS